jgi:GntR family transcriptional regulator / MocR family aminotransferase
MRPWRGVSSGESARWCGRGPGRVRALRTHAPNTRITGLAAGFHAAASLPEHTDEQTVTSTARTRSIGLHGMSAYRFDDATTPPRLVLGFGNLTEQAIERGHRRRRRPAPVKPQHPSHVPASPAG